jgi:DNA-binding NtrC family response regulator
MLDSGFWMVNLSSIQDLASRITYQISSIKPQGERMNGKKDLFLIVDDEPDMCWALEHILKKRGLVSKKALTGKDALALMEVNRFRLAFVDAKLADIEGLELARRLRKIDSGIHIVMISGYFYRDDDAVQKAAAEGLINGFIGKPFDHDEILKAIEIVTP